MLLGLQVSYISWHYVPQLIRLPHPPVLIGGGAKRTTLRLVEPLTATGR